MDNFTVHRLRFVVEVETPMELNEHTGSAIRGALFHALRREFCYNKDAKTCGCCSLHATCPICFLVSTYDPSSKRGADVPRPYTVEPPLNEGANRRRGEWRTANGESANGRMANGEWANHATRNTQYESQIANHKSQIANRKLQMASHESRGIRRPRGVRYEPGQVFSFGLTIFARALQLFPYVVLAVRSLERGGLGRKIKENNWRRGTFRVREVWAENPLTGERQLVLEREGMTVQVPDVPITHAQVVRAAQVLGNPAEITLHFLTPARLIEGGRLLHRIAFRPLVQRLHGRLRQLSAAYSDTPLDFDFRQVMAQAEAVQVVRDETRWVELESYSTRQRRSTPLGGLMGRVTFRGELEPFLVWLIWGQYVHVGKDAVKGNGMYELGVRS